jgi:hypothetical protein
MIENLVKRAHTFNLPSDIMGPAFGVRQLCGARRYKGKPGEPRVRGGYKRLSTSLTVRPKGKDGDTVLGLPPAVRRCPEVEAAARAGLIRLHTIDPCKTKTLVDAARAGAEKKAAATKAEAERLKKKAAAKAEALVALKKGQATTPKKPSRRTAPKEDG